MQIVREFIIHIIINIGCLYIVNYCVTIVIIFSMLLMLYTYQIIINFLVIHFNEFLDLY